MPNAINPETQAAATNSKTHPKDNSNGHPLDSGPREPAMRQRYSEQYDLFCGEPVELKEPTRRTFSWAATDARAGKAQANASRPAWQMATAAGFFRRRWAEMA